MSIIQQQHEKKSNRPSKEKKVFIGFVLVLVCMGVGTAIWLKGEFNKVAVRATHEKQVFAETQAKAKIMRERQRAKKAEQDRTRSAEVSIAFRSWLRTVMDDPSIKPRQYVKALQEVSVRGNTLVLGISIKDKDEAVKFCNFSIVGWQDREKYGLLETEVVFTGEGLSLAKSVQLNNGAMVCK